MYGFLHSAQVETALLCFSDDGGQFAVRFNSVRIADQSHVLRTCRLELEKLATDTAVYFIVAFLIVAQTHLHPALDVRGGEEDDAAAILQPIVQVDEVMKHTLAQFVCFVEE